MLVFYDIPQLFIARDVVGTHYICVNIESSSNADMYVGIQISQNRLYSLFAQKIDLRQVFIEPEIQEYYAIICEENQYEVIDRREYIEEKDLPSNGFFVHVDMDDAIEQEVIKLHKPVFYLGLEDEHSSPCVNVKAVSQILSSFDGLYSNLCSKLKMDKDSRSLKLYAEKAASYNMHFYADTTQDLFGNSLVEDVFGYINKLFQYTTEAELVLALNNVRGYSLSHYKGLISALRTNKLSLKYKYLTPSVNSHVVSYYVDAHQLGVIDEILRRNDLDNIESVEFVGVFSMADATKEGSGKWTFDYEDQDGNLQKVTGDVIDVRLLTGVNIKTKEYKILCDRQKRTPILSKEKIQYTLIDVIEL